jgi:hypothetical protein
MNERVKNTEEREETTESIIILNQFYGPPSFIIKNKNKLARLFLQNKTELARPSVRRFHPNRT